MTSSTKIKSHKIIKRRNNKVSFVEFILDRWQFKISEGLKRRYKLKFRRQFDLLKLIKYGPALCGTKTRIRCFDRLSAGALTRHMQTIVAVCYR